MMTFNQHFVLRKLESADPLVMHALDSSLAKYGVRNGSGRSWWTIERYRFITNFSYHWRFTCFEVQKSARILSRCQSEGLKG